MTTPLIAGAASIRIDAPPADTYAYIADIANLGRLSPECIRTEWDEPDVTFTGYNQHRGMRWATTNEITSAEPGRRFAFTSGVGAEKFTRWAFELAPNGAGTVVTESFEVVELPMFLRGRTADELASREAELCAGVEATLVRLKAAVEAGPVALPPGAGAALPSLSVTLKDDPATRRRQFVAMEIALTETDGGPPTHRHLHDDEAFYVLDGMAWFAIDDRRVEFGPGGYVLVPAGTATTFGNVGPGPARMLCVTTPRSAHFLSELQHLLSGGASEEELADLDTRYDIERVA